MNTEVANLGGCAPIKAPICRANGSASSTARTAGKPWQRALAFLQRLGNDLLAPPDEFAGLVEHDAGSPERPAAKSRRVLPDFPF